MGSHRADKDGYGRPTATTTRRARLSRPLIALAVAGLILVAAVIAVAAAMANRDGASATASTSQAGTSEPSIAGAAASQGAALQATAMRIPAIGVSSELVPLKVSADGVLQPPDSTSVAGWFAAGTVPGDRGPAVIAGHVDSRQGPGVFFRLRKLSPGQEIQVDRSDGRTVRFQVTSVATYSKDQFPTQQVYGPTPAPELRLITCGGDFDRSGRRYLDNVVVTATMLT